jgi:hypothetical protein
MKELAALALVVLPLGMTIVEILAAGNTSSAPQQRGTNIAFHANPAHAATATPKEKGPGMTVNWSNLSRASGAPDGHAVPGKTA